MWFLYVISIAMIIVGIFPSNTSMLGWLLGGIGLLAFLLIISFTLRNRD